MINNIQLIRAVKEHRCLYDHTCFEQFTDRDVKKNAWMEVTKSAMGAKFDGLSESARTHFCNVVQKRWRHLRDAYVKTTKQNKTYVFKQELSFLNETVGGLWIERKKKLEETKEKPEVDEPPQAARSLQIQNVMVQPNVTSGSDLPPDITSARKGKKSDITEFEKRLLNIVKNNVEHSPSPPDPDEMFFMSQMPHIKALSPADREHFKHQFMELLKYYTTFYD